MQSKQRLPEFLRSADTFREKLDADFDQLGSEKGDRFARFAMHVHDLTSASRLTGKCVGKTGDEGIDLEWHEGDRLVAVGQSKYKIREKGAASSVTSKHGSMLPRWEEPRSSPT